jgi:hypothetical protein
MTTKNSFSTICSISNGQSVENLINQLQEQCPKFLSIKNGTTIQIFDNFPVDVNFDRKTTDDNISKYYYHDCRDNQYIFFKPYIDDNMSLESSEKSLSIKSNSFIKKVIKKKVILVDNQEELEFYHFDYPVELISNGKT